VIVGSTTPRLWTKPLVTGPPGPCGCGCALTEDTSYGFDVVRFAANTLRTPLDPWQRWVAIHGGELLPDGRPRFRRLLILVARQNGKTLLLVVLSLWWMFVECVAMVLGTSTKLEYAAESWRKACRLARRSPALAKEISHRGAIRKANGEQELWRASEEELALDEGSRYKIAASNEEGGRSLTVDRLVLDELRHHYDYSAYDASVPTTNAVPHAQVWGISNAGSARSVVLNSLRADALAFITTGEGDERLGLFEYSAPEGSSPIDPRALAMANPNLNHPSGRNPLDALIGEAITAMREGGTKLQGFKTEAMCMSVKVMDPAVTPESWKRCEDVGDLEGLRDRVVLFVDISLDGQHASLVAGAVIPAELDERGAVPPAPAELGKDEEPLLPPAERVRIDVVKAWSGPDCTTQLRRELRSEVVRVRPRALGWFPNGPAAEIATELAADEEAAWPPAGVEIVEVRKDLAAVCMGFAGQAKAGQIAQPDDPMINAHVLGAEKSYRGSTWVFVRKGAGHCDGAYAAAGVVHLARTLPPPPKPLPRSKVI
jgi:hypothetical protein